MIPRCWPAVIALTLSMRFCGPEPVHAGTIQADGPTIAAGLSSLDSLLNIDKTVGGLKRAAVIITHPFHPRKALERAKMKDTKRKK